MIYEQEYLKVVSETKADITSYINNAIEDSDFRNVLIHHLLTNNSINI